MIVLKVALAGVAVIAAVFSAENVSDALWRASLVALLLLADPA